MYAVRADLSLQQPLADVTAERILDLLFARRRSLDPTAPCASRPCPDCFATHVPTIRRFVELSEPVHFVIPAFPAKSRNRRKTLGRLPDLGERLALESMQAFCDRVAAVYAPGAIVTICSDGHVFSDVLDIPDEHVDHYGEELLRMIHTTTSGAIGMYGLRDAMPELSWTERRRLLLGEYAEDIDELRAAIRSDEPTRQMFNGIHRFVTEDNNVLMPELSATQRRNRAKQTAYEVVQRSQAWSRLVQRFFPDAVRLSIHPQAAHSPKIGFHLISTTDNWLTPWHAVVLEDRGRYQLVKRAEAESIGADLVWRDDRPSHFVRRASEGTHGGL